MDKSIISVVQCGADRGPYGLSPYLVGGSYEPLIDGHIKPFLAAGGERVCLHNPFGVYVPATSPRTPRYRFTAQKMGNLPRVLAARFAEEWAPVIATTGLKLSVYIGPIEIDPCADDSLSSLLHNIGLALTPFLGIVEIVYHDAMGYYAATTHRGLKLATLVHAAHDYAGLPMGIEGPVPLACPSWMTGLPMFCSEVDYRKFVDDKHYPPPAATTRWVRDIPLADFVKSARAVTAAGHLCGIDLVGYGLDKWESDWASAG